MKVIMMNQARNMKLLKIKLSIDDMDGESYTQDDRHEDPTRQMLLPSGYMFRSGMVISLSLVGRSHKWVL